MGMKFTLSKKHCSAAVVMRMEDLACILHRKASKATLPRSAIVCFYSIPIGLTSALTVFILFEGN
jgi:hypothetical protein